MRRISATLLALLLSGCLPGQQRTAPRELFPADSLSRQIAEAAPVDTLELVWRTELPAEVRFPLTLAWDGGRIAVADLQAGGVHWLTRDGTYIEGLVDERLEFPLLAGMRGDTTAVLSRGNSEVVFVEPSGGAGRVAGQVPVPRGSNQIALWSEAGLFVKLSDEEQGSTVIRVDAETDEQQTFPLDPPYWRHIGMLRAWGDSVLAVSGYRPVVDVIPPDAPDGHRPDTLALMGFDSPQLPRSRAFVLGDAREPPLLVPSAAAAGRYLFVLNARPGWPHIDVFRRGEGELRLVQSLLGPEAEMGRNYFAADLAVRATPTGYDILVLEARPLRAVVMYRWTENGPSTTAPPL